MWKILEKRPFFRADLAGLGKYRTGGFGRIGVYKGLRLDRGGGQQLFLSCACFLITQPLLNIFRHAIHQIKAEYHSYPLVLITVFNSSDVKLKIVKEIEK